MGRRLIKAAGVDQVFMRHRSRARGALSGSCQIWRVFDDAPLPLKPSCMRSAGSCRVGRAAARDVLALHCDLLGHQRTAEPGNRIGEGIPVDRNAHVPHGEQSDEQAVEQEGCAAAIDVFCDPAFV